MKLEIGMPCRVQELAMNDDIKVEVGAIGYVIGFEGGGFLIRVRLVDSGEDVSLPRRILCPLDESNILSKKVAHAMLELSKIDEDGKYDLHLQNMITDLNPIRDFVVHADKMVIWVNETLDIVNKLKQRRVLLSEQKRNLAFELNQMAVLLSALCALLRLK